jgi:hypothetical protein
LIMCYYSRMNEVQLKTVCQKTGWSLKWDENYFSEERFENDVFFDLVEEQGFGFALDWKFIAAEVLEGIKQCVPLDIIVLRETITLNTLKPFNSTVERYRTAVLKRADTEKVITYTIDEPGYLAREIMLLAGYDDKEVVDINPNQEDTYWFALINKGLGTEDLEPFTYNASAVVSVSRVLAQTKQAAQHKYFYLPIFTTNINEVADDNSRGEVDILEYKNGELFQPDYYASRVMPGQTLEEAVKQDLATDFRYDGRIKISDYRLYDMTNDKQGNELPRLIVNIEVDRFNLEGLMVLNTTLQWQTFPLSVMSSQVKLGFDLREEVIN